VEVDAAVIGQGYTLDTADAAGTPGVDRRRLTSYLGLQVGGLGRKDWDGLPAASDQFSVTVQLRVDSDFGDYLCNIGRLSNSSPLSCLDPIQGGVRTDPELSNYRPELLTAYAEGRNLGGFADVRVGRQLLWDVMDLRALDGAWLRIRTPLHVAFEGWGGVSPNAALVVNPSLYAIDGTSRSLALAPDDPKQQFAALQPTVGASILTNGLRDVQGRISYHRTFSSTADLLAPGCLYGDGRPCAPESGTIEERVSYTLYGRFLDGKLNGFSALRYDLLNGRFDDGELGLYGAPARNEHIRIEYRYSAPSWDGDSIFNVFATEPYHHLQASYDGHTTTSNRLVGSELSWHASAFTRLFESGVPESGQVGGFNPAVGGDAGIAYRRPHGFVSLDGYCDGGYGGVRAGANLSGRLLLWRDTVGLESRAMYIYWSDDQRQTSYSHGMSLQAGVRWAIVPGTLLHVMAEDNVDRFYNSQFRLLAVLDVSYLLGPHGGGRPPAGFLGAGFGGFSSPGLGGNPGPGQGPTMMLPGILR
jgi:hypothetical protein